MLSRFMTGKEQLVLTFFAASIVVGSLVLYFHENRGGASESVLLAEPPAAPAELVPREAPVPPREAPAAEVVIEVEPALAAPVRITVSIRGAVHEPGLYHCGEDTRVQDLIEMAAGARDDADLSDINMAARLIDGSTLTLPGVPEAGKGAGTRVLRRRRPGTVLNPPEYTLSGWRRQETGPRQTSQIASGPSPSGGGSSTAMVGGLLNMNRATQSELESLPGIGPVLAAAIIQYRAAIPFKSLEELMDVNGIGPKRLQAIHGQVTVR